MRPIDNIVDITNYVMLEYGQPMHAFDIEYVKGHKIIVRNARTGETIQTLDGVDRTLSEEMLVIADEEKASAVAGVMGGENSGIHEGTHTVVFESACFKGSSVRVTAKKLGMRTESSSRFEKGLDPQNCLPAVMRACELVEQLGAGEVVDGVIDVDNSGYQPTVLHLDPAWINTFLGTDISREKMEEILKNLQFGIDGENIIVPSFRGDVQHKADVAEEIARFYGYNNIPTTTAKGNPEGGYSDYQQFERTVNQNMLAQGMYEIMTYSFVSPKEYDRIRLPKDDPKRESVVILNPLGEDTSIMRTNAIPSMMLTLAKTTTTATAPLRCTRSATSISRLRARSFRTRCQTLRWECTARTRTSLCSRALWRTCWIHWELRTTTSLPATTIRPSIRADVRCSLRTARRSVSSEKSIRWSAPTTASTPAFMWAG